MADRDLTHLQKMNVSKRGTNIQIQSPYTSLLDMINSRGDEYPSLSELDSYNHGNTFHELDGRIESMNTLYTLPPHLRITPAAPGDRTCNWEGDTLFIYRGALTAGLRFPFHEFIPRLLADVQINPCQLPPNAWRNIICFMVLCLRNNFPLSVAVFRKVFQFYNSAMSQPGWVLIRQRPKIPHIFDSNFIVENNPKWRDEFVRLTWAGGNWATLFRRPFCKVSDGSPGSIRLSDEEEVAYQALISDDGKIDTWTLLEEFSLKKVGLSQASDKACQAINNVNRPKEGESGRQKRAKLNKDPRSKPDGPSFLKPHVPVVELGDDVDPPLKAHSFRPNIVVKDISLDEYLEGVSTEKKLRVSSGSEKAGFPSKPFELK
ncbi:hypothetical protein AgCh_023117 [Apium graveolens]